ncbi:MAG: sugar phosphate nucleotidyltransferase [candidate division Zixibacteria bacterium]|nr:sugar phosphate nucleotidyltransferase [candidate division Zixibacteria bacterium]
MKVIVPVAGIGNRLRPHTLSLPKPLLRIAGKTILDYVLEPLTRLDLDEVVFVTGFKGDQIRQYVESKYSFKAKFVQQKELLGLGFAVLLALNHLDDGPVLVILGDTIVDCDLKEFITAGDYALGVCPTPDPKRFGIADMANGVIKGLEEKPKNPKSDLALIGLYYFKDTNLLRQSLDELVQSGKRTNGEIQITDALTAMIQLGIKFSAFKVKQWYDCGKKETLLQTSRYILGKLPQPSPIEGSVLLPPLYVAKTARIVNSIVGPNVSIADGVEIINSIIRNSVLGRQTRVENTVIEESLMGQKAIVRGSRRILNISDSSEVDCG